jgi:hypothetical protein
MLNGKFFASNRHYKEIDLASKSNCTVLCMQLWQIQTMKIIDSARPVDGRAARINVVQIYHPLHAYT